MALKSNWDQGAVSALTREFVLPSGGLLYPQPFPSTVIITPYSYRTEGILGTNLTYYHKLSRICQCVVSNFPASFEAQGLLLADALAIIAIARGLTYGESYTFSAECPECDHLEKVAVKVPEEIPIKNWNFTSKDELVKALMKFKLPHCKDVLELRPLTLQDEHEIYEAVRRKAAKMSDEARAVSGAGNQGAIRMARRIVSVNGGTPSDLDEAVAYVKTAIVGPDMIALEDHVEDMDCGIKFRWDMICEACGASYEAAMPLMMEFFRRSRP